MEHTISFGKEWRQYTVDMLNGKGHSDISIETLINQPFSELILKSVSRNALFESSIVESMSKIYYNKNQEFIKKRIQQIQSIFREDENADYLRLLIGKKLE